MKNEKKWVFTFGPSGTTFQGEKMEGILFGEWFDYPLLAEIKKTFTQHELVFTLEERIRQLEQEIDNE